MIKPLETIKIGEYEYYLMSRDYTPSEPQYYPSIQGSFSEMLIHVKYQPISDGLSRLNEGNNVIFRSNINFDTGYPYTTLHESEEDWDITSPCECEVEVEEFGFTEERVNEFIKANALSQGAEYEEDLPYHSTNEVLNTKDDIMSSAYFDELDAAFTAKMQIDLEWMERELTPNILEDGEEKDEDVVSVERTKVGNITTLVCDCIVCDYTIVIDDDGNILSFDKSEEL